MNNQLKRALGPAAVLAALAAMTPFNMGGCASSGVNLPGGFSLPGGGNSGNNSGGNNLDKYGKVIDVGGKFMKATSISEEDEDEMGRATAIRLTNTYGLVESPKLGRYVNLVGLTVASQTRAPDGNWVFGVLNTPEVNAFSAPNGYVLVTLGAINRMEDESELAGVLAHEIGHVINRDGFNAVKDAAQREAFMQGVNSFSNQAAQFSAVTSGAVKVLVEKPHDRGQETKADEAAVKYLAAAGYDPAGFLHYIDRLSRQSERSSNPMSVHPGLGQRVGAITASIQKVGPAGGATLRDRFLENTRGK